MNCKCIEQVNKQLAPDNVAIDSHLSLNFETGRGELYLAVPVRRIDSSKRNKLPNIIAAYCPICGKSTRSQKKKAKRKKSKKKAKA